LNETSILNLKKRLTLPELTSGILTGNRVTLSKAITLVESVLPEDEEMAAALLETILPHTGKALRIGITGVPGVGKSTFIETFGNHLTSIDKKLAVLTIDPSSQLTHGSILGDKTRMESLSKNPNAYIRPSASGSTLGGVAHKTREAALLCEAAGFDIIIIETVGTGQSETAVKNMVDFFLLLMLAGAGDELQGIKKGIMEMADALVITKADGENKKKAAMAVADYTHALHLFQSPASGWTAKVMTCSAQENEGIGEVWNAIEQFEIHTKVNGFFLQNRKEQNKTWLYECFNHLLQQEIKRSQALGEQINNLEKKVESGSMSAYQAAKEMLKNFRKI
jgi:LAO/AO transport system kinase